MIHFFHLAAIACVLVQTVHAFTAFTNPQKSTDGSDPFMVHKDRHYYLLTTTWTNVQIRRATTISGLKTATPTVVWSDTSPSRCLNVWALELHQVDGIWYIYYTEGMSASINNQHPMSCKVGTLPLFSASPLNLFSGGISPMRTYTWKSTIIPTIWATDATVANLANAWYIFFSAFTPSGLQSLYGAEMSNAWTVTGDYALISNRHSAGRRAAQR